MGAAVVASFSKRTCPLASSITRACADSKGVSAQLGRQTAKSRATKADFSIRGRRGEGDDGRGRARPRSGQRTHRPIRLHLATCVPQKVATKVRLLPPAPLQRV